MGTTLRAASVELMPSADDASNDQIYDVVGNKTDTVAGDSLVGLSKQILAEVTEIETHIHSGGRFFGSGGVDATALISSLTPWNLVAGTGDYGTPVQIFLGDEDFDYPITVAYFDPHRLLMVDASDNAYYKIRFANSGWNGTAHTYANMAAAIAANKYTESFLNVKDAKKQESSIPVQTGRCRYGSKLWASVYSDVNGADVDLFMGVHGYAV